MTTAPFALFLLLSSLISDARAAEECDADPDNLIKYDRTIGGKGVAPSGTDAFSTSMRGLSVDYAEGVSLPLSDVFLEPAQRWS